MAQGSSTDSITKQLSIFNCLEEVNIEIDKTKIPVEIGSKLSVPIPFQAINFWAINKFNKDSILETRIEFLSPKKDILHSYEKKYEVKKGPRKFRNTINFQDMPITESGRYEIRVYQKNIDNGKFEVVAEVPLDLNIVFKSLE